MKAALTVTAEAAVLVGWFLILAVLLPLVAA